MHLVTLKTIADCMNPLLSVIAAAFVLVDRREWNFRGFFFLKSVAALVGSFVLAHLNRWLPLLPDGLFCPSGHMTFYTSLSISLWLLNPGSILLTIPLGCFYAWLVVHLGFHPWPDVFQALVLGFACTLWIHKGKDLHGCPRK